MSGRKKARQIWSCPICAQWSSAGCEHINANSTRIKLRFRKQAKAIQLLQTQGSIPSGLPVAHPHKTTKSSQVLILEHSHQRVEQHVWNEAVKKRFHLSETEADDLERGVVLWRGPTAFLLEWLT